MLLRIIAVGTKMPVWVEQGFAEYAKRIPADFSLQLVEIPLGTRSKNADIARLIRGARDAGATVAFVEMPSGVKFSIPLDKDFTFPQDGVGESKEKFDDIILL